MHGQDPIPWLEKDVARLEKDVARLQKDAELDFARLEGDIDDIQRNYSQLCRDLRGQFRLTRESRYMAFMDGTRLSWTFSLEDIANPMLLRYYSPGMALIRKDSTELVPLEEDHWNAIVAQKGVIVDVSFFDDFAAGSSTSCFERRMTLSASPVSMRDLVHAFQTRLRDAVEVLEPRSRSSPSESVRDRCSDVLKQRYQFNGFEEKSTTDNSGRVTLRMQCAKC